ncbi:MAG: DUF5013 domain-containing protein [Tannerella sp.]|jgi:hypothetical protein|nr:DUF5013 domain-containing protein [Tannerella sp.]
MNELKKIIQYTAGVLAIVCFTTCKDMESVYKDFIVPGGKIYTGKPVNPVAHPGYNRIKLSWLKGASPSVTKAKVSWNNYTDSIMMDIAREQNSVEILIDNLPENLYSFFITLYDDEGNASIATEVLGTVYGEKFRSNLLPRPVLFSEMVEDGTLSITWGAADVIGGAIAVELFYVRNGQTFGERIDVEEAVTKWSGDTSVDYFIRTLYLPDTLAIDTLYTDPEPLKITRKVVTSRYMKNTGRPFAWSSWDGSRYGILRDWITNDAVKNKGGYGGYDDLNGGGCMGAEQWTTDPAINNGKIYQTFTIDPGRYQLVFDFGGPDNAIGNTGNDARYLVVARGNTLPDVDNISSAIASASLAGMAVSTTETGSKSVEFEITQPTEISAGLLVHFVSTRQNLRGSRFQLLQLD